MRKALAIAALAASLVVPVVAFAQPAPPSPSPELRSMMEKVRAEAKTAAFGALSPARAASVTAIVSQVSAGTLEPRKAGEQIDGMLTGNESKAVLAAAARSREMVFAAMRAAGVGPMGPMRGGPTHGGPMRGGPPPGGPPHDGASGPPHMVAGGPGPGMGGPPRGSGWHGHRHRGFGRASAGRYLVMLSIPPDRMRMPMPRARSSSAP